jgi:thiamine-phosphate pyrophosphorylase
MNLLPKPTIMLVTDRHAVPPGALPGAVAQAVAGGVNVVQLREKDLPVGDLLALGAEIKAAIAGRALFLVNDRVDVALALDADGVHLPQDGVPVAVARRILGHSKLVGRSVHSEATARTAAVEGADYLVLGPVYETASHPGFTPPGLDVIAYLFEGIPLLDTEGPMTTAGIRQEAREVSPVPVIGIGGITPANAAKVMQAGALGVAVVTSILGADSPEQAARELVAAVALRV